jgi:hypothetical protein
MLLELEKLLVVFEWITNEFQGNVVSSSRVYPCITSVKSKLLENPNEFPFTHQLRKDLYESVVKRFSDLIETDCFLLATFLDPVFGPKAFPLIKRDMVKQRLKYHIGLLNPLLMLPKEGSQPLEKLVSSNFTFYDQEHEVQNFDDMDAIIEKYCGLVSASVYTDSLAFWKAHENSLPLLAPLAKKFLGVPASSASVERMFNISGHVFSNKRRRTGVKLFENLVFLKLNENYL